MISRQNRTFHQCAFCSSEMMRILPRRAGSGCERTTSHRARTISGRACWRERARGRARAGTGVKPAALALACGAWETALKHQKQMHPCLPLYSTLQQSPWPLHTMGAAADVSRITLKLSHLTLTLLTRRICWPGLTASCMTLTRMICTAAAA